MTPRTVAARQHPGAAVNPAARAIRSAPVSFMLSLGIPVSSLLVLVSYERNGFLPDAPLGLGLAGPFEQSLGRRTFVGLAIALIVVCLFDVVVGVLLWTGRRAGGVLGPGDERLRVPANPPLTDALW